MTALELTHWHKQSDMEDRLENGQEKPVQGGLPQLYHSVDKFDIILWIVAKRKGRVLSSVNITGTMKFISIFLKSQM